jgi:hypothetical protein
LKTALNNQGRELEARKMQNLVRYRAMESLCRQSAVFHPQESWRLLAEAEMWHHKALEEIASSSQPCAPPSAALARTRPSGNAGEASRSLTGRQTESI